MAEEGLGADALSRVGRQAVTLGRYGGQSQGGDPWPPPPELMASKGGHSFNLLDVIAFYLQ